MNQIMADYYTRGYSLFQLEEVVLWHLLGEEIVLWHPSPGISGWGVQ